MSITRKYFVGKEDFKYLLIWFLVLCSVMFYTIFLPYGAQKLIVLLGSAVTLVFIIIHTVYGNTKEFDKRFTWSITAIFICLFTSTLAASIFHNQNISNTVLAQYDFYFFLFYFLLHKLKPDPERLIRMFVILGYVYCGIYLLQYFAYPTIFMSSKVFIDRGTIRIFLPGIAYMFSAWFILLSKYYNTKKLKYIIGLIPILIITFLLATRQLMASFALLTLLSVLLSKKLKSKITVYFLIVLCIIPFYFLFQGIFEQMLNVTQTESTAVEDNIRVRAATYFLFEFNSNKLWLIFGNGMPDASSAYGRFLEGISESFGYYQTDIGIIGDFTKFGVFFVIAQFAFLIGLLRVKYTETNKFIIYNTLSILMTMFTGAGLHAATIAVICMMMYIADVNIRLNKNLELESKKVK